MVAGVVRRAVSMFFWVVASTVIAFVLLIVFGGFVMDEMLGIRIDDTEAILLGVFLWVIVMVVSRRAFFRSGGMEMAGGGWQPATTVRETVVNSPQFRGKVDRRIGLLEATVRRPQYDHVSHQKAWSGSPTEFNIITVFFYISFYYIFRSTNTR